ncbi:TPA: hypothetical protein RRE83_005105 [Klebsiella pneumoniae]|uniref:hypothetical protein n=1 Tax=Klebsiella TaxID=570 RepID=UPI001055F3F6|nr:MULTISPECIES: hypothetical protein [Klebsiella]HCA9670912.1 hypothetical protein [Klebsiella variicola subsp. variicola]MBZ7708010.1 hypothetical protein [Klebsiella oxytoca]MCX2362513.1 hypothetical protein [Klebsiella variicola]HBS6461621.1 hypothetical protein [Klebsiella pneumoniae]HBZ7888635.1 hypothetical protein [Klebsiella pneumoniae]
MLDLYCQNKDDDENSFTLGAVFDVNTQFSDLVSALLPLIALYDACFGYCLVKKNRDRILNYTSLFHE